MRCAVGVDLGASTGGALTFARWLAADGSVWSPEPRSPDVTLLAIHVIEEKRHAYTPTLASETRPTIVARLQEHGLAHGVEGPFLVFGASSGPALLREAQARSAECLIVGRPESSSPTLGRLGPMARHLLRELALPAAFVPARLHLGELACGPVLLAVDQLQPCHAALEWAHRLARHLRRELLLVHALPQLEDEQPLTSGVSARRSFAALGQGWSEAYARWSALHGEPGDPALLVTGHATRKIVEAAERHRAALIVCPMKPRSLLDRMFNPALAPMLTAYTPRPILVVPQPSSPSASLAP